MLDAWGDMSPTDPLAGPGGRGPAGAGRQAAATGPTSPPGTAAAPALCGAGAPRPPAVAIFDLDGTLVLGQTQVLLVRFLRSAGLVSRSFVAGTALWFLAYKAGLIKVTEASRAKGGEVFEGLPETEVESLMARFTDEVMVPRLHPASAAALAEHQAEGDIVVVISAALDPLVEALCRRLGVADYAGARCADR